ncbi:hypothetical protein GC093_26895 [Paenibacillus sp. LMG 31456]|uniref:Lipoprotein n=1 Tax=Paenibacillus foliorum TaxID=2654974 RepID=A0A972GTY9_9BACL|nr:hypothetical protein [Paenibacillus foliorum]NOU96821.1 hypothetical protein [Paenibacillus foliorum]
MARVVSLMLTVLILISITACSSSTNSVPDKSKKALFVGRENGGDGIVIKHIKALGYQVEVSSDKDLTAEKAVGYTFVFVSSTVNSNKVGGKLKASPVPVIYAESQNMGDLYLAGKETDTDNGDFAGKSVTIKAADHPIAAGLKGNVEVYQQEGKIGFTVPSKGGVIVASAPDNDQKAAICVFEKGAKNMNNEPLPARQVYFYLVGGEEINQTDEGWKLFNAAVQWAIGSK